jgi:hypothetical protein
MINETTDESCEMTNEHGQLHDGSNSRLAAVQK